MNYTHAFQRLSVGFLKIHWIHRHHQIVRVFTLHYLLPSFI